MPLIYHVTTKTEWDNARQNGSYRCASLVDEGFIHCSQEHQVIGVLQRYFEGKTNLVKLIIDTDKLRSRWVFDWSPAMADTFPHVYGPINVDSVVGVTSL